MTSVHPSAHVASGAQLGAGVSVGPGAVIDAGAIIGAGTVVMAHAIITAYATVGENCRVHHGALVGGDPQDLGFSGGDTRALVGDRVTLREYSTVHRASRPGNTTIVGADCYLMANAHIAHDAVVADRAILCNGALVAGHVTIGERVFLSGNSAVHQFCRVGALAMIGGGGMVARDLGPFLTMIGRGEVRGVNVVGMRRAGYDGAARRRVQAAYRALFDAASLEDGLAAVAAMGVHPELKLIADFFIASRRGVLRPEKGVDITEGA